MKEIYEKVTYINEIGERVEFTYSFPYFLQEFKGSDGLNNTVIKHKSLGMEGSTFLDSTLEDRSLSIIGKITGNSKEELSIYRNKLLKVFNPKLKGEIVYEYGNIVRRIECNIEGAPKFQKENIWKYQTFLINLISVNPYWKDVEEKKQDIALWKGDFEFELEILDSGIELGHREPSLIVNISNQSDVECGIKIEFRALGTVINPLLFNVNTREFIKVNKTMIAGEKITITTHKGNKKILQDLNGIVNNAMQFIDVESTFLQLDVGDNLFRYDADKNLDNLEVSIYYTPQFLGV